MRVACFWFDQPVQISQIAESFLRFSPQISVRSQQAFFIEIGKCRHLYSESSFLARAKVLLNRFGVCARLGLGSDITDSLTQAMYQKNSVDELPLQALLELADPFDRDPVLRKSVLHLIHSFQDLGIQNVGQFKKLKVSELIARFGVIGRHCYSRAHMQDFINWPLWVPEETILEKKEFSYFEFYGELDPILFELKSQLDLIFSRLFARRQKAMKLQIQIRCEKVSTNPHFLRSFDFDFFSPQGNTKSTLKIFKERLSREFQKKPVLSPIEAIQTKVLRVVHADSSQKNIFNNDEEKLEQIHSLHNQLIELLGKENIFQAQLTEDRRPERSWKKNFDSPHEMQTIIPDVAKHIPDRATYLCRYPMKVEVTAGFVHIKKKRYRILRWDNDVEKICGGWFEKPQEDIKNTFNRSYYNVEIEGHQRISIFEAGTKQYYLHGYYG